MDQNPSTGTSNARAHVEVQGRVQGVGFRAHVEYHARKIGNLTGWVRNVGDDIVEAVIEGERSRVEQLIQMMKDGPRASRVDTCRVDWEQPIGEFIQFGVRHSI